MPMQTFGKCMPKKMKSKFETAIQDGPKAAMGKLDKVTNATLPIKYFKCMASPAHLPT